MRTLASPCTLFTSRLIIIGAVLASLLAAAPQAAFAGAGHTPRTLKRVVKIRVAKERPAAPIVGLADQRSEFLLDPLFAQSGLKHARLVVGWNAIYDDAQRADMDAYLNLANALHIDVLLTFGNARNDGRNRPTPQAFMQAFRAVRARYPWLTSFGTWNEPNIQGASPQLTAQYWRTLQHDCPACTILAADLVDQDNMQKWVRSFLRAAKREPRAWGLHNYVDANKFIARGTRTLLKATRGEIWLTETGGVVERHNASKIVFDTGTAHAAQAVRFIFDRLVPLSPRIKRVYLYNWRAQQGATTWDSALTNADGSPRAAYDVLREQLRKFGVAGSPPAALTPQVPVVPSPLPPVCADVSSGAIAVGERCPS